MCMFGYMTELETVTIDEAHSRAVQASGHDIVSLVFNFLDELLYRFHSEGLVVTDIKVVQLDTSGDKFYIKAHWYCGPCCCVWLSLVGHPRVSCFVRRVAARGICLT